MVHPKQRGNVPPRLFGLRENDRPYPGQRQAPPQLSSSMWKVRHSSLSIEGLSRTRLSRVPDGRGAFAFGNRFLLTGGYRTLTIVHEPTWVPVYQLNRAWPGPPGSSRNTAGRMGRSTCSGRRHPPLSSPDTHQRLPAGTVRGIHAETPLSLDSFRPQRSIMKIQRRYAPISGRFETESLAGLTGIYNCSGESCSLRLGAGCPLWAIPHSGATAEVSSKGLRPGSSWPGLEVSPDRLFQNRVI